MLVIAAGDGDTLDDPRRAPQFAAQGHGVVVRRALPTPVRWVVPPPARGVGGRQAAMPVGMSILSRVLSAAASAVEFVVQPSAGTYAASRCHKRATPVAGLIGPGVFAAAFSLLLGPLPGAAFDLAA